MNEYQGLSNRLAEVIFNDPRPFLFYSVKDNTSPQNGGEHDERHRLEKELESAYDQIAERVPIKHRKKCIALRMMAYYLDSMKKENNHRIAIDMGAIENSCEDCEECE